MSFKCNAKQIEEQLKTLIKMFGEDAKIADIQSKIYILWR